MGSNSTIRVAAVVAWPLTWMTATPLTTAGPFTRSEAPSPIKTTSPGDVHVPCTKELCSVITIASLLCAKVVTDVANEVEAATDADAVDSTLDTIPPTKKKLAVRGTDDTNTALVVFVVMEVTDAKLPTRLVGASVRVIAAVAVEPEACANVEPVVLATIVGVAS